MGVRVSVPDHFCVLLVLLNGVRTTCLIFTVVYAIPRKMLFLCMRVCDAASTTDPPYLTRMYARVACSVSE